MDLESHRIKRIKRINGKKRKDDADSSGLQWSERVLKVAGTPCLRMDTSTSPRVSPGDKDSLPMMSRERPKTNEISVSYSKQAAIARLAGHSEVIVRFVSRS